jgi:hypothetical protein
MDNEKKFDVKEKLIELIRESIRAKYCVLAGRNELAYEHLQNLEDELTTLAIIQELKIEKAPARES